MIIINIETGHHIEYTTLINDLRLYDEDRETILRMKIMNITTEVFRSDRNSEREYCLD